MKKILMLVSILFMTSGCYDYHELNDLAIVSGISVSFNHQEYEVVAEVVNPKSGQDAGSFNEPDFVIYKNKGSSIQEAFRGIVRECPQKLYGAHINVLIIDESVALLHMNEVLDFFARNPEIRNNFYVLVSKNQDILSVTTPLENISSQNIIKSLESNSLYLGTSRLVSFQDLIYQYLNPYLEISIPSVTIIGNENKADSIDNLKSTERDAAIYVSGEAVFKNEHFIGYLDDEDSLMFHIVTNQTTSFLIKSYFKQSYFVSEIFRFKSHISTDIKKNEIYISIDGDSSLVEVPFNDYDDVLLLEKELNLNIEKKILNSFNKVIEKYHSDIYGFKNEFFLKDPHYVLQLKQDWNNQILDNIQIRVNSNIHIIKKGNLNGGIHE